MSHPTVERVIDRLTQRVTRFWLRFDKIVKDEQETNFITRLHDDKLSIIPWYDPLIPMRSMKAHTFQASL